MFVTTDSGLRFNDGITAGWKQYDITSTCDLRDTNVASHKLDLHISAGPSKHAAASIAVHPDCSALDTDQSQFQQDEFTLESALDVIAAMLADYTGGLKIKRVEGTKRAGARTSCSGWP